MSRLLCSFLILIIKRNHMRKKKQYQTKPAPRRRPKRTAHRNVQKSQPNISKPDEPHHNHQYNAQKHHNKDMRVIVDMMDLEHWLVKINNDSGNVLANARDMIGVACYFIGQKCERFPGDSFMSGDIDLTNMFFSAGQNKIRKCITNFKLNNSHEEKIGKGIIVKANEEEDYNQPKTFILFEDLYSVRYSYKQLLLNAEIIHDQFERITYFPMQGICIKIIDPELKHKLKCCNIETIINFII